MTNTMKFVSPTLKSMLPEVFIEYLWTLVSRYGDGIQFFSLSTEELSGRSVQNIVHHSASDPENHKYRVFGIEPVEGEILIETDGICQQMLLL